MSRREQEFQELREQGDAPTPAQRSRYHREISALARQQELDHFGQVCKYLADCVEKEDYDAVKKCQKRLAKQQTAPVCQKYRG